jgi:hypothetical protein
LLWLYLCCFVVLYDFASLGHAFPWTFFFAYLAFFWPLLLPFFSIRLQILSSFKFLWTVYSSSCITSFNFFQLYFMTAVLIFGFNDLLLAFYVSFDFFSCLFVLPSLSTCLNLNILWGTYWAFCWLCYFGSLYVLWLMCLLFSGNRQVHSFLLLLYSSHSLGAVFFCFRLYFVHSF